MARLDPGVDLWSEITAALARAASLPGGVPLERGTPFDDLGIGSLDLLTFAFELEEKLDVNLAELLSKRSLVTLGDAHDLLLELVVSSGAKGA